MRVANESYALKMNIIVMLVIDRKAIAVKGQENCLDLSQLLVLVKLSTVNIS